MHIFTRRFEKTLVKAHHFLNITHLKYNKNSFYTLYSLPLELYGEVSSFHHHFKRTHIRNRNEV